MNAYTIQLRRRLDGRSFTRKVEADSPTTAGFLFNSSAFEVTIVQVITADPINKYANKLKSEGKL